MPTSAMMNRVKMLLEQRQMSQSSFAREIGVSPQTLSAWFSGRNAPSVDAVVRMCTVLGDHWTRRFRKSPVHRDR